MSWLSLIRKSLSVLFASSADRRLLTPRAAKGAVFVGDTLFKGSVGRTDLDGGDSEVLAHSLQRLKCELDPTSLILSGHGEQTEFAQELKENPFLA